MSFSAHADAKGIMQLISWCEPKNVMLVHGEAEKMDFLKTKIQNQFGMCINLILYICGTWGKNKLYECKIEWL